MLFWQYAQSQVNQTIVLSVEFEAIVKKAFSLNMSGSKVCFYLPRHFVLTCNIRAMFCVLSVTHLLTCYARAVLWGQRSSVQLHVREERA